MGWKTRKNKAMYQNKIDGGLKMPDVEKFIQSLKCTWIRRLITSLTSPWAKLFETSYGPIELLFKSGSFFLLGKKEP